MYTKEQIEAAVKAKGYKWFEDVNDKGYDVNIVGVRNNETKGRVTNAFDDHITISYKIDGEWQFHCYKCTTDPGKHWVENIMRKEGVAVLKPGQYRGSHKIRLHAGKYPALGQQRDVTVYRDNNKDDVLDFDCGTQSGLFGINCHRSNQNVISTNVDKWSAGCQVFENPKDFSLFMDICNKAANNWGNKFSYTLLLEDWIK